MDNFTMFDWYVAGTILAVGIIGAVIKVFCIDDPEIKQYHDYKKRESKR